MRRWLRTPGSSFALRPPSSLGSYEGKDFSRSEICCNVQALMRLARPKSKGCICLA